jgi:tetratricopeptide (TPR) repeat protein
MCAMQQDVNDRIARFRQMVESNPDNILARFSLSQAYFDSGDHALAAAGFREVIARKADWMLAHLLLGRSLVELGRPAEARPVLEAGLNLARQQGHEGPQAEFSEVLAALPR